MTRTLRTTPMSLPALVRGRSGGTIRGRLRAGTLALMLGFLPVSAGAYVAAGDYLAGLSAREANDFSRAAEYFSRALGADGDNPVLMEETVRAFVALGRHDLALPAARQIAETGLASQMAAIALMVGLIEAGDWDGILADQGRGQLRIAPLIDSSAQAWALAATGKTDTAAAELLKLAETRQNRALAFYQLALLRAMNGDLAGAEAIFSGAEGPGLTLTRRGTLTRIEILSQLGRTGQALALLTESFPDQSDPPLARLRTALEGGQTLPLSLVTTPREGLGEAFFTIAVMLNGDGPDAYSLAFSRTAERLFPGHVDAVMLSATLLEKLEQYDLALAAYDHIPAGSDYSYAAELSRAEAMRAAGRVADSILVLQQLTAKYPGLPAVFSTLGDALRSEERFTEATQAYDQALRLSGDPRPEHWVLYFMRGITLERQDLWERAEADLRLALLLRPDQPQVLNYLGYSFLEQKRNLDEALSMIEKAVSGRPDDGYITDSLGWAFYRLGRFPEAVVVMERAAALMPVDPEVNDHLGDVYWAVGRKREAEFQWKRALSFQDDRDSVDYDRIRRKLEVGLDAVLAEEGAPPLSEIRR